MDMNIGYTGLSVFFLSLNDCTTNKLSLSSRIWGFFYLFWQMPVRSWNLMLRTSESRQSSLTEICIWEHGERKPSGSKFYRQMRQTDSSKHNDQWCVKKNKEKSSKAKKIAHTTKRRIDNILLCSLLLILPRKVFQHLNGIIPKSWC